MKEILKEQKLLGITLLFLCLFNAPILGIFNKQYFVWGVPLLYLYVFSCWVLMIILVAWIVKSKNIDETIDE